MVYRGARVRSFSKLKLRSKMFVSEKCSCWYVLEHLSSKVIKNWPKPLIKIMPRAEKLSHQSLITPRDSHRGRAAKPKLLRRRIEISVTKMCEKIENFRKYSYIHEYTWITSRLIFNFNRKLVGKLVWGWSDQFSN